MLLRERRVPLMKSVTNCFQQNLAGRPKVAEDAMLLLSTTDRRSNSSSHKGGIRSKGRSNKISTDVVIRARPAAMAAMPRSVRWLQRIVRYCQWVIESAIQLTYTPLAGGMSNPGRTAWP
jgi:hypothetical protein